MEGLDTNIYEELMLKIKNKDSYNKIYLTDNESDLVKRYGRSIIPAYLLIQTEGSRTFLY